MLHKVSIWISVYIICKLWMIINLLCCFVSDCSWWPSSTPILLFMAIALSSISLWNSPGGSEMPKYRASFWCLFGQDFLWSLTKSPTPATRWQHRRDVTGLSCLLPQWCLGRQWAPASFALTELPHGVPAWSKEIVDLQLTNQNIPFSKISSFFSWQKIRHPWELDTNKNLHCVVRTKYSIYFSQPRE